MATYTINRPNFLASEVGLRLETTTVAHDNAQVVSENGRSLIKAGTVYPANGSTAKGIIFQDVDVTDGDAVAPLMVSGYFYTGKVVGGSLDSDADAAFKAHGLFGVAEKSVTRPY